MERLPEEIITLIWQYEGRYIESMKQSFSFICSTSFRRRVRYNDSFLISFLDYFTKSIFIFFTTAYLFSGLNFYLD